jgi:hypothetical protein
MIGLHHNPFPPQPKTGKPEANLTCYTDRKNTKRGGGRGPVSLCKVMEGQDCSQLRRQQNALASVSKILLRHILKKGLPILV